MSALRALLQVMPDIVAVVQQVDERWQTRVFDALVNAALSDAGTNGWTAYDQGRHGETAMIPRVDEHGYPSR